VSVPEKSLRSVSVEKGQHTVVDYKSCREWNGIPRLKVQYQSSVILFGEQHGNIPRFKVELSVVNYEVLFREQHDNIPRSKGHRLS
jgi:hypothetical protein